MKRLTILIFVGTICAVGTPAFTTAQIDGNDEGTQVSIPPTAPATPSPVVTPSTYQSTQVPMILSRSTWETPELKSLVSWIGGQNEEPGKPKDYQPVERIFIHYTDTPQKTIDTYSSIQIVQSIFRFHAVTRGWGDIGYHYLIDQKGNIFEGRLGGNGVRGAHVYSSLYCTNYNFGTIGITLIGNYQTTDAPETMYQSLARLVGWLTASNSIDPANLTATTQVWQNPKPAPRSCDVSTGSYTPFTGPVVLGHKDVPGGSADPGLVDLARVRREAAALKTQYESLFYDTDSDSTVVFIKNGVVNEYVANRSDAGAQQVVRLLQSQRDLFPLANPPVLAEGALIKSYTREEVYRLENGKRRLIVSPEVMRENGYDAASIKKISERQIAGYPLGTPLTFRDGTLMKGPGEEAYLVEGGKKRHITSALTFRLRGYKWREIRAVDARVITIHESADPVLLPDRTLVRVVNTPSVYRIKGKEREPVPSAGVFKANGFRWENILIISQPELEFYNPGAAVPYPDGIAVRAQGEEKVYLFEGGKRYWVTTASAFRSLGLSWAKVILTNAGELIRYAEAGALNSKAELLALRNGGSTVPVPTPTPQPSVSAPSPSPSPAPSGTPKISEPLMRIGILSVAEGSVVRVSANGPFEAMVNGTSTAKQAGEIAEAAASKSATAKFTALSADTVLEITTLIERPSWNPQINYNRFRGAIEIKYSPYSSKIWVVNELPLEAYLSGMAEALNSDHEQYLTAFAIVTRSYALFHYQNGGKRKGEIFHLNRTASDQVYKGYTQESLAPRIAASVAATRGEVAVYQGRPMRSVYSSDSGGITKSACVKWGGEFCDSWYDYLDGGVKDPEGTIHKPDRVAASHGVGMSAIGARKLAELEKTYKEILTHYYRGVVVEKWY